jgi:hypothetical protein
MNLFLILFSFDFSCHVWSSDNLSNFEKKKRKCKDYLYVDNFLTIMGKLQHIGELAGLYR